MKNKSIGSLIVLAILAPSCGGGGSSKAPPKPPILVKWQTQQRSPTSSDLRSVIFANPTQGIIGGKNGTIFRTDDGGATWTQQEFIPSNRTGDINAMSALGTTLAAAGKDAVTGSRLWDGRNSTSWVTADAPGSGPAANFYTDVNVSDPGAFSVPGTYWALRDDGIIDYSFNGAAGSQPAKYFPAIPPVVAWPNPGWDLTPTHPVDWTQANGIVFIGVTGFGMVCGIDNGWGGYAEIEGDPGITTDNIPAVPNHGPQGQIARTDNYGVTWVRQTITPAANIPKLLRRIDFTRTATNLARAYACGDDNANNGVVFVSSQAVADQWDLLPNIPVAPAPPPLRALDFPVDDETGWVVGDNGAIYKITAVVTTNPGPPITRDYVYSWAKQAIGLTAEDLYAVSFADENTGYVVGDNGIVLKTVNGGTNWVIISKGATNNFNAVAFTDDGIKGIAVGDAGAIYRTLDSGTTWTSMGTPAGANNLFGASVPRGLPTTAFLCGAAGTLMRNTDVWGVGTWIQAASGTNGADTYEAILFPLGADKGVCVGSTAAARRLLRTSNGTDWLQPTFGPTTIASSSYKALSHNLQGTEVYAAGGTNGVVSFSQDLLNGWDTWVDSPSPPAGALTLSSVAAPTGGSFTAFAGASNANLYRLPTGSGMWQSAGTPFGGANATRLAYQNDQVLICVTSANLIFTTSNGGGSWSQSYAHTKDLPRNVWMSPSILGLGYVVCSNGTILRTVTGGQ